MLPVILAGSEDGHIDTLVVISRVSGVVPGSGCVVETGGGAAVFVGPTGGSVSLRVTGRCSVLDLELVPL